MKTERVRIANRKEKKKEFIKPEIRMDLQRSLTTKNSKTAFQLRKAFLRKQRLLENYWKSK